MTKRYVLIDDSDPDLTSVELEAGPIYVPAVTPIPSAINAGSLRSLTPMLQDATWRTSLGGYPTTYSNTAIKCRFVPKQKTILKTDGTLAMSSAIVRCASAIKTGDRLIYGTKDSLVLAVNPIIGIGGEILEYEVIL